MDRMSGWATGFVLFAAIIMMVGGVFQAIAGLAAIIDDDFYLLTSDYVFKFSTTTWGWIHLIGGIVVAIAGFYLLSGKTWAIVVGMVLATLSAIINFAFIPYYPFWSLLIIAIDILIIWSLAVYGRNPEVDF